MKVGENGKRNGGRKGRELEEGEGLFLERGGEGGRGRVNVHHHT